MAGIDYRYNAQERVKVAILNPDETQALVTAQIATAEAVLALVEQQRIANLIALMSNAARMVAEGTTSPSAYSALHEKTDPTIREALGL